MPSISVLCMFFWEAAEHETKYIFLLLRRVLRSFCIFFFKSPIRKNYCGKMDFFQNENFLRRIFKPFSISEALHSGLSCVCDNFLLGQFRKYFDGTPSSHS